ncbi:MAG TPA: hypothetical protein DC049_07640, partial [Spirochaetia bacterium]|nr:hypothetical protein [Spirochaetia bacterium]
MFSLGKGGRFITDIFSGTPHSCSPSAQPGWFKNPESIACDYDGNVYIADTGNNRIQIFDSTGNFKSIITDLKSPRGVYIVNKNFAPDRTEYILAADTGNNLIKKYYLSGEYIGGFNGLDNSAAFATEIHSEKNTLLVNPVKTAMDEYNRLVVLDEVKKGHNSYNRVLRYDYYGNILTIFSNIRPDNGEFKNSSGITFDRLRSHFLLGDSANKTIEKIKLTIREYNDIIMPVANIRLTLERNSQAHHVFDRKKSGKETLAIFGEASDAYFNEAIISYGAGNNPQ